jgi:hypothetical protein
LRQEVEEKQHDMELRISYMFELFEMQLLSVNATPILSKDNLMDIDVGELSSMVERMKRMANAVEVTEEEKKQGINRWSKMLDKFSNELHKDIERIIGG